MANSTMQKLNDSAKKGNLTDNGLPVQFEVVTLAVNKFSNDLMTHKVEFAPIAQGNVAEVTQIYIKDSNNKTVLKPNLQGKIDSNDNIDVVVHEFSHFVGLPDRYIKDGNGNAHSLQGFEFDFMGADVSMPYTEPSTLQMAVKNLEQR